MSAAAGYQWTFVSRAHSNPDAITSIKAWGSAGDAGPALGSLVKHLLVKFNRQLWFKPPSHSLSSSASLCFFSSPYLMSFLLHCPFPHPPPLHLFLSSSSFSFVFIEYLFLRTNGCVYLCFFLHVYSVCLLLQLILIIIITAPTLILLRKYFFLCRWTLLWFSLIFKCPWLIINKFAVDC